MIYSEIITMRKKLKQQREIFNTRKKRSKNKKIALQNRFVFTTKTVLKIAKKAESTSATKSTRKQP